MASNARTVLFVQRYPDGGSITGLLSLIRGLDRRRHHPIVCFPATNPFVAEFEREGVPVLELDAKSAVPAVAAVPRPGAAVPRGLRRFTRELRRTVRRDIPTAWRLRQLIRAHGVDLIHANNDIVSNRSAIVAAALTGRPVVVHVRWIHAYERNATWLIDRVLARRVDRFLYMSRAIASGYAPLAIPASRQLVIDDPFEPSDYLAPARPDLAAELAIPAGVPVVAHVGRIVPWKGQDVFLRAVAEVFSAVPGAVALVVGGASGEEGERFERELMALADDLGITERVIFTGGRRDMPQIYALADVVVHSSTSPEPFGRVIVEAMAAGKPVVAADAGGVGEIITSPELGLLVPPGRPTPLAEAVRYLLDHPRAASAMGSRARMAVEQRFSLERHARAVEAIYDELMSRPRSARRSWSAVASAGRWRRRRPRGRSPSRR